MQYNFSKNKNDLIKLSMQLQNSGFKAEWKTELKQSKPIQTSPLLYERITYGEGANIWFEYGKKPGLADHYLLHQEKEEN